MLLLLTKEMQMAQSPNPAGGGQYLRIEAQILDVRKDDEVPSLVAYTFSQSGRLLGRSALKEGKAELPVPPTKEPEAVRVAIGPNIDSEDEGEVLSALMRLGAPERMVRPDQLGASLQFQIDRPLWHCWFRWCLVRGTLLKRVTTGGLHVNLPVCGAEIEIYEVDPVVVILPKIPDLMLERIRDLVRKPWPPPPPPEERFPGGIPFPPLPPGPGPDPAPFLGGLFKKAGGALGGLKPPPPPPGGAASVREEVRWALSELRASQLKERPAASAEGVSDENQAQDRIFNFPSGEALEVGPEEALASVQTLADSAEIKSAASVSLSAFKTALLAKPELLRPLLCWIWPPAVNIQLVAKATTDECGKFRAVFFRGCSTDTPDLYFKAYRRIGFFRFLIYGPLPIACHTWWNYACGTEVTLITTNPFALTCPPCQPVIAPPHWVLAMAVGNTSLAAVRGTSQALQPTTNASNIGLTSGGAPFGGYVRLRFEFDNTLRTDLNVRYYRLRWRKIGSGNPFVDLTDDVWRHYAHMVGTTLMIEPYKLGPQPVGGTPNLYEIPPALPPAGQWSIPDAVVDTTSAAFPAAFAPAGGGEGDYQFELTLFDAAGAAVNATTLGINYVVPTTLDLTTTIPTVGAATLGLVTAGRLVFQLHIDNNPCDAALQPPDIAGSASADPCGLLRYAPGDSVNLHWTAAHPHSFATFKHAVVKGATELPAPITTSGFVGAPPGVHSDTHSVASLLGGCTIAGFAETVSVWAMATDGWSRQQQYDDHAIQAFALAPHGA
jgi:hypothetical protein